MLTPKTTNIINKAVMGYGYLLKQTLWSLLATAKKNYGEIKIACDIDAYFSLI
jgi:hypothetical protein